MKYSNDQLRKTKNLVRVITFFIILILMIHFISYYKSWLYFTDTYMWYNHIGKIYCDNSKKDQAFKYAVKAIDIDPNRPEAHKLKTKLYLRLKQFHNAKQELSILKDMNESLFYYSYMGFITLEQDMNNESYSYFKKGMEVDPFFVDNHLGIGLLYLKMNDTDNAYKYLSQSKAFVNESYPTQSLEKQITLGMIHAGLGFVNQQEGDYEKANEEFKAANTFQSRSIEKVGKELLKFDTVQIRN